MAIIINGKELAAKVRANLKIEVDGLKEKGIFPKLAVIMVGNDSASAVYVRNKSKACNEIGVEFEEFLLSENTTREELLNLIEELNNRKDVNGILLQSPIPKHLDIREAFNAIDYKKRCRWISSNKCRQTSYWRRLLCILYTSRSYENARRI